MPLMEPTPGTTTGNPLPIPYDTSDHTEPWRAANWVRQTRLLYGASDEVITQALQQTGRFDRAFHRQHPEVYPATIPEVFQWAAELDRIREEYYPELKQVLERRPMFYGGNPCNNYCEWSREHLIIWIKQTKLLYQDPTPGAPSIDKELIEALVREAQTEKGNLESWRKNPSRWTERTAAELLADAGYPEALNEMVRQERVRGHRKVFKEAISGAFQELNESLKDPLERHVLVQLHQSMTAKWFKDEKYKDPSQWVDRATWRERYMKRINEVIPTLSEEAKAEFIRERIAQDGNHQAYLAKVAAEQKAMEGLTDEQRRALYESKYGEMARQEKAQYEAEKGEQHAV